MLKTSLLLILEINSDLCHQSRLLPIGPPSDVMSTAEPPSMVGPLAFISETTIPQKKVDQHFSLCRRNY